MANSSRNWFRIKFMSTDLNFTTQNPKLLAGIKPRATEDCNGNDGGMAIDLTASNNPGAIQNHIQMTIDQSGYVGIGTLAPQATLHVKGDGDFDGDHVYIVNDGRLLRW